MDHVAPQDERTRLLKHIEDIGNRDVDSTQAVVHLREYLASPDPEIVLSALQATWNYAKDENLFIQVLAVAKSHADEELRGLANSALGAIIREGLAYEADLPSTWQGTHPGISSEFYVEVRDHLLHRVDALMESMEVRRRCLEALGYLAFKPEIRAMVLRYYHQAPNPWVKVSAIYAMGLFHDPVFERLVLEELHSSNENVLLEAVHSAGNLELQAAQPRIRELAESAHAEVRYEAIMALGMSANPKTLPDYLDTLATRFKDPETVEAMQTARQTAMQRSKIVAGDPIWDDGLIMNEIDDMISGAGNGND